MALWTSGGNGGYVSSSSSSATYTFSAPLTITAGGGAGGSYSAPASRPKTALEWLDDETEAVCKLARLAG